MSNYHALPPIIIPASTLRQNNEGNHGGEEEVSRKEVAAHKDNYVKIRHILERLRALCTTGKGGMCCSGVWRVYGYGKSVHGWKYVYGNTYLHIEYVYIPMALPRCRFQGDV